MSWTEWVDTELRSIEASGRWRRPRSLDAGGPVATLVDDGRTVVSFASNDYLGLTTHPDVIAAAHAAIDRWGTGSGSARLIVGSRPIHDELEDALATWKGTAAATLFPTGFAANLGVLASLGGPGVRIVSDELNHASIIDGCRLSRAEVAVYRHVDVDHAARLLATAPGRAVLVTDTVFSMDGDLAPVDDLLVLAARHDAAVVLDEAHAVLGPDPDPAVLDAPPAVLRVGTLSKSLGALGGFVAASRPWCDLLVNRARSYIFTTALPPADAAAALAAVGVVRAEEGATLRARLRRHVEAVAPGHPSPVVPVVIGDEGAALAAADALLERGLLVPAIRPPTVAPGTSRLRVALRASHTDEQVAALVAALGDVRARAGV